MSSIKTFIYRRFDMFTKTVAKILLTTALVGGGLLVAVPAQAATGSAPSCQCVDYVMKRLGLSRLSGNYPTAASLAGDWTRRQGFRPASRPATGQVVILQPYVAGAGSAGHIGVIDRVGASGGKWVLVVRSANWVGARFTEAGCSNVSLATVQVTTSQAGVSYWTR